MAHDMSEIDVGLAEAEGGSPAWFRLHGNHLKDAPSLYLRQHAHNPVEWYPWGETALRRAAAEDKPIFLSIGYSSCHWCHVMEREVFERDGVAAYLNEHFVNIKVDREERPDLDAVYMEALQLLTGGGGWPMSMFLTPQGKPFFGATYVPHDAFLALARQVSNTFSTQRGPLNEAGAQLERLIAADPPVNGAPGLDSAALEAAVRQAKGAVDVTWGGFQTQAKFPLPARWLWLLHQYRKTGDTDLRRMLRLTLDMMSSGGLQDHLGGGFHRYTVEPTWLVPHFEKMLYDNAQLAALYTEAAVVFREPRYERTARRTLDFLLREMRDPAGGFYASFDADSQGEEGRFYVWTPEELAAVAGEAAGPALAEMLGVTEAGNFEGRSVLSRRSSAGEVAARLGLREADVAALFDKWRERLRDARAARVPPTLDRKIVTSWNGLAIFALAQAYLAFGEEAYRKAAVQAAQFIWETHREGGGGLYRSSTDGTAQNPGILDDYAFLADGLLALYSATGDPVQLERALLLLDYARDGFAHPQGGCYLTGAEHEAPLGRQLVLDDGVEPSGNAAMLHVLVRAAAITGRDDYYAEADRALQAYSGSMQAAGLQLAWWLDAALLQQGPFYQVVLAGEAEDERTRALLAAYRERLPAGAVLLQVGADGPEPRLAELAAAEGKTAVGGVPTAHVCRRGLCLPPTQDPGELRELLAEGWRY